MLPGPAGLEIGTLSRWKSRHLSSTGPELLISLEIFLTAPTPQVTAYLSKPISSYFQKLLYLKRASELVTSVTNIDKVPDLIFM